MRARLPTAFAAAVLIALATASTATAAVTIGQLAPGSPAPTVCINPTIQEYVQPTVTSGNAYVVPATGGINDWTVTSWSHNASADAGQMLKVKFYRQVSGSTYMAVSHDGPRPLTAGAVNTFTGLNLRVKPGDILGSADGNDVGNACTFAAPGDAALFFTGDLADGEQDTFTQFTNNRVNISAVITPTNTFTLGAATRNKKKGTATIAATVPNSGDLTASGKGVSAAGAAAISKAVTPGTATLRIKAKGKKKRKLNDTGKVKLNVAITFTPTGGDPSTQSRKVKLKKKL